MEFLQHYWWIIISLLGGILVFLLFVQGGQTLLYTVAKNEDERNLLVNSLGRKWEFTFTTLVVFGGAFFASFPLFYSTSFGGAYLAWMVVLFCFVIQAVSYEYRRKANNFLGERTYNAFLVVNGILGTICIGAVVSSFFTGNPFTLGDMNQVTWQSAWRGLEVLFSFTNLCLGFSIFFLARTLAVLYFLNNSWTKSAPYPRECAWLNSMDNFASALRCGTPLLTTPQEGRNAVLLINAMYESAYEKNGEWVAFKH